MAATEHVSGRTPLRDPALWYALAAGPVVWILLAVMRGSTEPHDVTAGWVGSLVLVVVAYPLLEEIVFRGGIQGALLTRSFWQPSRAGISLANVATSTVFAAVHLLNHPPLWASLVWFPSLVFGWARDRYQCLWPSVLLHAVYNLGYFWLFAGA